MQVSIPEFLKKASDGGMPRQVRCAACRHAAKVRAYSEVIDCTQKNRMQNAETLRNCFAFELA